MIVLSGHLERNSSSSVTFKSNLHLFILDFHDHRLIHIEHPQRLWKWKMKTDGIFLSIEFIQGGCLYFVYIVRRPLWTKREWKQRFSTNQPRRWSKLEICKFGFAADQSSTMVIRSKNCTGFTWFRFGRKILLSSFHPRIKQKFKQRSSAVFLRLLNSALGFFRLFQPGNVVAQPARRYLSIEISTEILNENHARIKPSFYLLWERRCERTQVVLRVCIHVATRATYRPFL